MISRDPWQKWLLCSQFMYIGSKMHWVPLAIAFRKQSQIHNAIARLLHRKDLPNGPSYAQNAHQSKKQHKMQRAKGSQCHGCARAI